MKRLFISIKLRVLQANGRVFQADRTPNANTPRQKCAFSGQRRARRQSGCPLYWKADSSPLDHQGSAKVEEFLKRFIVGLYKIMYVKLGKL